MLICGAGLAAALPGAVAAHTDLPVIGVPLRSSLSVLDGLDALLAIAQMPPGVPVAAVVDGDEQVLAGVLAPGRYATLRYTGHPDGLLGATASLLKWAEDQGLTWDVRHSPDGERWGARLEIYETDPAAEPDMAKWTTQLAFRLAGQ